MENSKSGINSGINYTRLPSGRIVRFVYTDPRFSSIIVNNGGPPPETSDKCVFAFMLENYNEQLAKGLRDGFAGFTPIHQNMTKYWFSFFVERLLEEDDEEVITQWLAALEPLGFRLEDDSCVVLEDEEQVYSEIKYLLGDTLTPRGGI